MHYAHSTTSVSAKSFVSDKVRDSPHPQQPLSPAWSTCSRLAGPIPTFAQPPTTPAPYAPVMGCVPLPPTGSYMTSPPVSYASSPGFSNRTGSSSSSSVVTLHPLLQHDPSGRLFFDLTQPVTNIQFKPNHRFNLQETATMPPVMTMSLKIQELKPASSSIQICNPQGITLEDVLRSIANQAQIPVSSSHFATLDQNRQKQVTEFFHRRVASNRAAHDQGLKGVDTLGPKILFVGLSRSPDGSGAYIVQLAARLS